VLKISDPAAVIGDPEVSDKMEKRADGFYVTAITGFTGQMQTRSERIDIVIGAGVRGQSYLYWRGDALFELPVSYWTDGQQWINSPGYRKGATRLRPDGIAIRVLGAQWRWPDSFCLGGRRSTA
jgi:hypothetical protein